jgi:anthranilate phosphoribosyltransferase
MKPYIEICLASESLTVEEAASALDLIMTDRATEAQIAGLLVALRAKGETVEELVGFARTMRHHAIRVHPEDPDAIDMCGTGGDGLHTFNISTVASLVVAGAGVTVAKHGNRSVSSTSGSADVLRELGVNIQIGPEQAEACINIVGIGFLFAPLFHPAMRYAAKPRVELGLRTIFNMLGPITNPAGVRRQLIGAYTVGVARTMAAALTQLDTARACVVHSADGMDEVSIAGPTSVYEVAGSGEVESYTVSPGSFGLRNGSPGGIRGGDAVTNAGIARAVLEGAEGPARDVVVANAAFGILVAGKAHTLEEGAAMAADSIDSGAARRKLMRLQEYTNRL